MSGVSEILFDLWVQGGGSLMPHYKASSLGVGRMLRGALSKPAPGPYTASWF